MIDLDFFKNFLEKYKITNYNRINYPSTSREAKRQLNREIIFNIDDNCYYKIINTKLTLLDVHYFLNNAYSIKSNICSCSSEYRSTTREKKSY